MPPDDKTVVTAPEVRRVMEIANRVAARMAWRITLDPEKLARVGLTVKDVTNA